MNEPPVPAYIRPIDPWPEGYTVPDPGPCNGLCLTGYDVGVPIPGTIAYPHPDCPAHGWVPPEYQDAKH